MYNIRASLQKYKIKEIHQKSPDRETVFNYHLNSGLTFNNHGFDTGKYDDPSVVAILTDSPNPSNYWKVLRHRLRKEGNELVTNCHQLKLPSIDGKYYKTDVATTEQLFRLIQSIPSPKAEPFKLWMAQVAKERLDEMQDPELTIDRAMREYKALGYSDNWINQRLKSIEIRNDLTDEWKRHGLQEGVQFATLTDIIYQTWAGKTAKEYKQFKGLKKESLRDNMTNTELALNMLAEAATTELSKEKNPQHFEEHQVIAKQGGKAAEAARKQLESDLGHSVISPLNARTGLRLTDKNDKE
ncbi:BRO family protein [Parabacteroides sp.]